MKAHKCLAFTLTESGGVETFFFMDENKMIWMLKRSENSRQLVWVKQLAMVELQRLDYKPGPYEVQILSERYAI